MLFRYLFIIFVFCGSVFSSSVQATLIGDTVNASLMFPPDPFQYFGPKPLGAGLTDPAEAVVGPGVEFITNTSGFSPSAFVRIEGDIGASSVRIDYVEVLGPTSFPAHTFVFSNLDWVGMPGTITGFFQTGGTLVPDSTSFTANSVTINMPAIFNVANDFMVFEITAEHVPVPEPSTYLLIGSLCAVAICIGAWKRKQKAFY